MAIQKSNYTGGNGRKQLPSPYVAHVETVELIEHTFTAALSSADVLELAYLPPNCRITDFKIEVSGASDTVPVTIGLMTGAVGSDDTNRTVAQTVCQIDAAGEASATLADLVAITDSQEPRSIGVISPSGTISAGEQLTGVIRYAST